MIYAHELVSFHFLGEKEIRMDTCSSSDEHRETRATRSSKNVQYTSGMDAYKIFIDRMCDIIVNRMRS